MAVVELFEVVQPWGLDRMARCITAQHRLIERHVEGLEWCGVLRPGWKAEDLAHPYG